MGPLKHFLSRIVFYKANIYCQKLHQSRLKGFPQWPLVVLQLKTCLVACTALPSAETGNNIPFKKVSKQDTNNTLCVPRLGAHSFLFFIHKGVKISVGLYRFVTAAGVKQSGLLRSLVLR